MRTPASIAKHPIHPMLITIPIGLWIFSFVCDLVFVLGNGGENWRIVAFYTMAGGIVGALLAAIPGFIDLVSLPPGVKRIALVHMSINLGIVVLYVINLWLRTRTAESTAPQWLSVIAIALLAVSGWLGGRMVHVHGVAVVIPPEPVQAAKSSVSPERRLAERRASA
jgi:uncharacterized membrane protein